MGNSVTQEQRDRFLSLAAEKGEVEKVDQLLKKGADPNRLVEDEKKRSRTSLHRAASTKNNVDVLTKLLSYIKDVDMTDDDGNTALHLAAGYYNNAAVVQTLLHAKPNCKIQNSKGKTALHSAIENGSDWKIVELLLLADSDPNISDFKGNTPLHACAAIQGCDDMVAGMLLRFGANPNLKNSEGQTPLHVAAKAGNKVVLLLLKFHAKVRLRDKSGRKPSDLADTEEMRRILQFEEDCLEERTVRVYSSPPFMTSPNGRYSNSFRNSTSYNGNGTVTPNGKRLHFWAGDTNEWKGYGGDGIIHLPDKSDIVVPPQAIPHGTDFKVSIKPSKKNENIPEIDFDLYDFEFDIKLELPGALLIAPWMADSNPSLDNVASNLTSPPAFTGFCTEGSNRWKSCREMACKHNGAVGLHFNLTREKGERRIYKIPPSNRKSFTEVVLERPIISKYKLANNLEEKSRSSSMSSVFSDEDRSKEEAGTNDEKKVDRNVLQMNGTDEVKSPDLSDQEEIKIKINSSSSESDSNDESLEEVPFSVPMQEPQEKTLNSVKDSYFGEERSEKLNSSSSESDNDDEIHKKGLTSVPEEELQEDTKNNAEDSRLFGGSKAVERLSEFLNDRSSSSEDENEQKLLELKQDKEKLEPDKKNDLADSMEDKHMSYDDIMEKFNDLNYTETDVNEELLNYDEEPRYQHPIDPALATIVEDSEEMSVASVKSCEVDLM